MKRCFLLVICICFIFSTFSINVGAINSVLDNRISIIKENVESYLESIDVSQELGTPVYLYNFGDEIEALLYPLKSAGYVVASYKDGHVIEYSPGILPIDISSEKRDERFYYGGPLSFFEKMEKGYYNTMSGELCYADEEFYDIDYVKDICQIEYQRFNEMNQDRSVMNLPTPRNFEAGSTDYYCTITGIANLLQYYIDFKNADMQIGSNSTVTQLRSSLNRSGYIYNRELFLSSAANAHRVDGVSYAGLRSYLSRTDVSNYAVDVTSLVYSNVVTQIYTYSRPVLITIYTSSLSSGAGGTHTVLCYGYSAGYYIVNNGWGSNGAQVCSTDMTTNFEMLYLY